MRKRSVEARAWLVFGIWFVMALAPHPAQAVTATSRYVATSADVAAATPFVRRAAPAWRSEPVPSAFTPGETQRARAYIEVRRMRAFVLSRRASADAELEQLEQIQRDLRDR
jgi:hypothetical protein